MPDREKVEFIESYWKIGNGNYKWNDNHGELIRCKDCKNRNRMECLIEETGFIPPDNWFCADGEHK